MPVNRMGKVYAYSVQLERALQWAIATANDDSHGYSQTSRWGPDYDCSSLVISALKNAGIDTGGASYTGNMKSNLTARGFEWIPWSSIGNVSNLQRGDILLNQVYHTAFYLGDNQLVEGHGRSQADKNYDSRDVSVAKTLPGDQNGQEIRVTSYYLYSRGWDGVLRYRDDPINTVQLSLAGQSSEFRKGSNVTFNWTWGWDGATGYDFYIAKKIPDTNQYDWNNAWGRYFSDNTTVSGVVDTSSFTVGEYAAFICARNTVTGKYGGQSNFVYFSIYDKGAQCKIWLSRTRMGSETERVPVGKTCYLCYQIIDKYTQKNWDEENSSFYDIYGTFTRPNGTTYKSPLYVNDNNCMAFTPEEEGKYKGVVEISGDFEGKLECEFVAKNFYYGDIDGDKDITVTDLSVVNQAANNKVSLTADQKIRADVNADGAVTKEDVTLIQQYIVGLITEFPAESHMHSYSSRVTKKATCSDTGIRTYSCACGKSYTETIPKTSHTPVADQAVAATCTRSGKTQGSHCSVCGTVITAQKTVAATGHVHTEVRNAREATSYSDGYTGDTYCLDCGVKLSSGTVITKTEHTHKFTAKITKEPTCTERGVKTYTCSCGDSYTEWTTKKPHTEVTDQAVAATCTRSGKTKGSHCSVCGMVITEQKTVAATGHIHTEVRNAKEATASSDGYTGDTYCLDCGAKISGGTVIAKTEHSHKFTAKITKEPTCMVEGVKTYTCSCGYSYTEQIAKKPHTEVTDQAVAATCTGSGKTQGSHCSVCGTIITAQKTVAATGHIHTEVRNAREATTLSDGYTGDIYCKDCGVKISSGKYIKRIQSDKEENDNDAADTDNPYEDDETEDDADDTLEVGDMLYDELGNAEYEVIKISGNTVFVSYNATLNKKQKEITIPKQIKTEDGIVCKVTAVSDRAFCNNKYVRKIVLNDNITKIGARAFSGCKKLSSLKITSKKLTSKSLSSKAFKGISYKTKIKVPKEKRDFYKKLFGKKGLSKRVKVYSL